MKRIFKVILFIIILLGLSSLGGYVYFKDKFKAPKNQLTTAGSASQIPITWVAGSVSDREALLLPVTLEGLTETFYMQFDLGSPITCFYSVPIEGIEKHLNSFTWQKEPYGLQDFSFSIESIAIKANYAKVLKGGNTYDPNVANDTLIIGTLGSDILEHFQTQINFKNSSISLLREKPDHWRTTLNWHPFLFEERRMILPAKLDGKDINLMWDSGASAYYIICSEKTYTKWKSNDAKENVSSANSFGRTIQVFTSPTKKSMHIANHTIPLNTVTHMTGFPWWQELLFQVASAMEGMVGNQLFEDYIIYLDAQNQTFALEKP